MIRIAEEQRCEKPGCEIVAVEEGRWCDYHAWGHVPTGWMNGQAQHYPKWQQWLLFISSFPFVVSLRILWQFFPYWPVCLLFWTLYFVDEPLRWRDLGLRRRIGYGLSLLGGFCNAVVTLANGGVMPVAGKLSPTSIWVPLTESSKLPWLADIYGGFSLGDFGIALGLLILLANWLLEATGRLHKESKAHGKRLPGLGI